MNCGSNDKKSVLKNRTCDELAQCMQDPHTYKQKKDQKKWKEYLQSFEDVFDSAIGNSWWACLAVVSVALGKYVIMK